MQHFINQHKLPIKSSARIHAKGGVRNSIMKTDKYFSELSQEQIEKLYEIYKYDFQMFGYEHESYLELSKLDLKKKEKPKDSFDLALEEVKNQGKYKQVQINRKKNNNKKVQIKKKKSNNKKL